MRKSHSHFSIFLSRLWIPLTLLLIGCQNGSSSKSSKRQDITDPQGTCLYSSSEGDSLQAQSTSEPEIVTSHFDKQYDHSRLKPILSASSLETARFIQDTGVELYMVPAPKSRCRHFNSLNTPPNNLSQFWNDVKDSFNSIDFAPQHFADESVGSLAGLYFYPNYQDLKNPSPTILIREDVQRWTLVHEWMHHLFQSHHQNDPKSIETKELRAQLKATLKTCSTHSKELINSEGSTFEQKDLLIKLAHCQISSTGLELEFLRRFNLEEVTIESLLIDLWKEGQFKYINQIEREVKSAAGYILYSYRDATTQLNRMERIISSWIKRSEDDDLGLENELHTLQKEISDLRSDALDLAFKYKEYSDPSDETLSTHQDLQLAHIQPRRNKGRKPCSHTHSSRDLLRKSEDLRKEIAHALSFL